MLDKNQLDASKPRLGHFEVTGAGGGRTIKYDLGLLRPFVLNHNVPASWRSWSEPRSPLPIDQEITRLIQSGRITRDGASGQCPYANVRSAIAAGILNAKLAASAIAIGDGEIDLRLFAAAAAGLKNPAKLKVMLNALYFQIGHLARFAETYRSHEIPPSSATAEQELLRDYELHLMQLLNDLPTVAGTAEREHSRITQYQGNAWKQAFATSLGGCWYKLTGDEPSSSSRDFVAFVEAAWRSICRPAPKDESWERPIRTACDRHRGRWAERHDEPQRIRTRGSRHRRRP